MIEFLTLVTRRWTLLLTTTLLAVAAAAVVTYSMTPSYRAESQLFVALQGSNADASELSQGVYFAANRVKSYPDIVTSPLVLDPVIEELGLDTTAGELADRVSAEVPPNTVLIKVSADDESPRQAAEIANSVSEHLITVVEDLDRTEGVEVSPVRVSVIRPATAPGSPRFPIAWLNIGIGLLAGLAIGLALAALWEALDVTVKSEADIEAAVGLPTLATIPVNPDISTDRVLHPGRSNPLWSEAYRKLRTNLGYLDPDNPPRALVVTSALAGDGKTVTAVNLAATLAQSGRRVILIEADLRRPAVSQLLHLANDVGVTSVVAGRATIDEVVQRSEGFDVITSGRIPPNPSELLGSQAFQALLETLLGGYDHIVIDTPPLIAVTDAAVVSTVADAVILVCQASRTKKPDLVKAIHGLRAVDANVVGVVLNRVPIDSSSYYVYESHDHRGNRKRTEKQVKAVSVPETEASAATTRTAST